MKKLLRFSLCLLVLLSLKVYAQDRTVTGRVTAAEDKLPMPGVTVKVIGGTQATQTNADGMFSIKVPSGFSQLEFSFLGYASQTLTIGEEPMNVVLRQDTKQLGEVVVTALGIQRTKNSLPYSAQSVKGEDVSKTRDANFINSLSGKVAGLEIKRNNTLGGSTNIVLRGTKSLTGDNQALFVVDGVPVDNSNTNSYNQKTGRGGFDYGSSAADINPDDIETISILKGAAATALYGSRASNGVVLIQTRKNAKGLGIFYNTSATIGKIDKNTFPKYQKKYGAGYGPYYEDPTGYFLYRDIDGDGNNDLVAPLHEDASYGAAFDPNLMVYQWDSFDPTSPNYKKATPWVAATNGPTSFFETANSINNSLLIQAGGETATFKLGYARNVDKGILPNSRLTKDNLNLGATFNINAKLTANGAINMVKTTGLGRYGTGYDDKNIANNFRQWWQTNVDLQDQKDAYFRNKLNVTWNWADPGDLVPIYWDNPYFGRYENYSNDGRTRYTGSAGFNYKPATWLDIVARVSADTYNEYQEERQAYGSVTTSQYSLFERRFSEYNYDLMANFNKDLSSSLNLKGVLGTNIRTQFESSTLSTTNGGLIVPRVYALSNSLNPIEAPTEVYKNREVDGIFLGLNFAYNDYLFLDLTGRRDQSSTLPVNNNSYYYPSASLGFAFSKLVKQTWLSYGKVRINYAEVGADAPTSVLRDPYTYQTPFSGNPMFSVPATKNNASLKPERTKAYEAGLEMAFLNSRVGFDMTYYKQNTVDQILPVNVSKATGYSFKYVNAGDVENRGIELSLYGIPVSSNDFTWKIDVNWSKNENEVKALAEGDNLLLASLQGGVSINAALHQPYGQIRGTNFVYTNGQKTVGPNGRYLISPTSNEVIGNVNPDWIGGINNALKFKNISLSFLIDIKKGGDVFSLDQFYGLATGLYEETAGLNDLGNPIRSPIAQGGGFIRPGVKADGTPNDIRVSGVSFGAYGYRYSPAADFVYDASYVKLREVVLSYSFPQSLVAKLGPVKGVDFSLIGRNLWIIHKNLPNADPEDGISSGNIQGYQVGSYPTVRTFGANLKFRF